jgi:hypothetical protein
MNLPKIELDALPTLDTAAGIFGSLSEVAVSGVDDSVVVVMVYVYETIPAALPA